MKGKAPPRDPFIQRRATALKALKDYRQGSFGVLHAEVIDVLVDESDRGAVMLVSGVLEDVLAEYIIAKLPNGLKRRDELLRQGGVLSSFSDKVAFALALGLIEDETADSLDIIRQLRNGCAHSVRAVTLKTSPINQVFGLLLTVEMAEHIAGEVNEEYLRFVLALVMVFHVERIRGKSQEQAQAVVDGLAAKAKKLSDEELAKQQASRGTQSKPADPDGPLNK